jgi:hypothetical protein
MNFPDGHLDLTRDSILPHKELLMIREKTGAAGK